MFAKFNDLFPEENVYKINSFTDEFDDINSYSNKNNNEFIPMNGIESLEKDIQKVFPIIFNDDSSEKTKDQSNEIFNFIVPEKIVKQKKEDILYKNDAENIQIKMRQNLYLKRPFKEEKNYGRKKKSNEGLGEHNKFSDDNLIRRSKHFILDSIFNYINKKIKILYSNESTNNLKKKQLLKLSQKSVETSKVEYNKIFIYKTLQSIFSENVSTRYSRFSINHNKNLIEYLLNEKDEKKRLIFYKIFNLTFLDCLKHFRGTIFIEELDGMKKFNEYLNETDFGYNSDEYKKILEIFINNYEKIIMEKKPRKQIKKNNNNFSFK
jgi:hypothetical protein